MTDMGRGMGGAQLGPINESSDRGCYHWIQVENFDFFILSQNHLDSVWELPRSVLGRFAAFFDSLCPPRTHKTLLKRLVGGFCSLDISKCRQFLTKIVFDQLLRAKTTLSHVSSGSNPCFLCVGVTQNTLWRSATQPAPLG